MKKIMTLFLAAALALSLAACSSGNQSSSSSSVSSEESSSSVSESLPESSEEEPSESSEPEYEIPEANKQLGAILDEARGEEMAGYYPAVLSKDAPGAELYSSMFGLNFDDMEAFAISISPMNVKAYGVAIIKPAEGKGETILTAVNSFVDNQKKAFENYLPDQAEIANAATVDQLDDGTVVLVMSEDGEAVQKALLGALKK